MIKIVCEVEREGEGERERERGLSKKIKWESVYR